ncbi:MAG TPA: DegT/DnrJ/EryC1/StrS family aminotransferase [Acidimicrobiales bacterium]|nr:DegT/DnrJ/EryC1/StrS family aminotransferase [Acidimicrobiales bacterium]
MQIPLVDLKAQHEQIRDEVQQGWDAVLARTAFVLGEEVAEFEAAFADLSGVRHCIGVANGTDALELALRALGVGTGDEVVVPANTFIASALAVARAGATPVLVDVDAETQLVDVEQVATAVTPRTRAIMPVDLFGQVAPMAALQAVADEHGIPMVEDAAQAQGARQDGRAAGSFGRVAGTSFYPGKNLGAYGDAGAVLTDDDEVAARVRALRNYGSDVKYHHPETGFNSRLDTLQAVVLSAKLRRLAAWNERRRQAAALYDELLADLEEVVRPVTFPGNEHVWHLYVVRVPGRDDVLRSLHEAGVGAGVHYPVPVHLQGAFAHLGHGEGSFPVTERAAREILSLPMYAEITPEQQQHVVDALRKALR